MITCIESIEFSSRDRDELDFRAGTVLDVLQSFAEVEMGDPRMMIVLATARIEAALITAHETYLPELPRPAKLQTCIKAARNNGLIATDFCGYADALRRIRNRIVHTPTTIRDLASGELRLWIDRIHGLSARLPVWDRPIYPSDDFRRSVYAATVAGVVVAEVDFFDLTGGLIAKGFESTAAHLFNQ
ncbi:hypothetical protein [Stieleria mannarensis]|uniref:hypothetical protein n=1 Tax=Stieleria mannarensis TaxID=2755585 RepID=UPI00160464A1|nr:hypothetical protein [Rhodopirellula sp. JC639]